MYTEYACVWGLALCNINKNSSSVHMKRLLQNTTLVTRMLDGSLWEFDPKKESMEDFHECFEFYCVANGIRHDNMAKKKAIFITLLEKEAFIKLKVL